MATVRMTHQMASSIQKKAMEAYEKTNVRPSDNPELKTLVRGALQRLPVLAAVSEFIQLSSVQRDSQYNTSLGNTLRELTTWETYSNVVIEHIQDDEGSTFNQHVELDTPISLPAQSQYRTPDFHINMFLSSDNELISQKCREARNADREWQDKRREFKKSIDQIIDSCNTVKQLLDVWPAAEKLLEPEVIQRLHTKVTRKIDADAVRERANFDPDQANQVLLTSSLLGD